MLNVQKVRLRFIFARALYLWRLFSKKLMVKGFSEPTRTSVVPYRSEFACKLVAHECTRMYIRGRGIYGVIQQKSVLNVSKIRLRYFFAVFLVSVPSIFKKANGKRLFRTDRDVREIEQ